MCGATVADHCQCVVLQWPTIVSVWCYSGLPLSVCGATVAYLLGLFSGKSVVGCRSKYFMFELNIG